MMNDYQVNSNNLEIDSLANNANSQNPFKDLLLQDRYLIKQRDLYNYTEQ